MLSNKEGIKSGWGIDSERYDNLIDNLNVSENQRRKRLL